MQTTETDLRQKVNYVVEKGAYVLAALIAVGFLWLLYLLMGWQAIAILVISFVVLIGLKVGFLWILR